MKKVLYFILILGLLTTCFSGCVKNRIDNGSKSNSDGQSSGAIGDTGGLKLPLDDKNTQISILVASDVPTINDSIIINELRNRTGINVQIVTVSPSTVNEKVKVLLASKTSMPDIFTLSGLTSGENHDVSMQGAFEPVNTHLDSLPNLKEIFYDNPKKYNSEGLVQHYSAPDGNLYIFPFYNNNRDVNHGMLYRKDIFDKHGLKMWNDKEDFYKTLKKLKELYPDSTPLTTKNGIKILTDLGASWGLNGFSMYYNEDAKLWKYSPTDEKFKDLISYVKKLYDEGLLDPEFLTRTSADWTSKMTQENKAFVTWDWIDRMDMFKDQTAQTVPDYDLRYGYPIGPTGKVVTLTSLQGGVNITKNSKSLLAMKLFDYLLSESGAQLMTLGIEGITYKFTEDKKVEYLGYEDGKEQASISSLCEKYGLFAGSAAPRFDKRSIYFNYTQRTKEAQDLMLNKKGGGFLPADPLITFTKEESDIKAEYEAKLQTAAEEFATKYILNDTDLDTQWNEWLEKAEKLGVNEIERIYNEAQDRFDSTKGE